MTQPAVTPDAYNDLGYAYDLAGYEDPAEAAYLRGIQADPGNARIRTNFGLMLARHGRTNEANPPAPRRDAAGRRVLQRRGRAQGPGPEGPAQSAIFNARCWPNYPNHVEAELHVAVINFEE